METTTPSRYIAAALGIFLGGLGLHLIYLRKPAAGVVWLLASVLLSWTVIVPLFFCLIGFFQGISYLLYDDASWERAYGIKK